ncbi:MAG: AAA family ATPase [Bacteroidota bacterium]
MQYLVEKFRRKLMHVPMQFRRSLMEDIAWEARLIGIKGARGAGKTTLMLQRIKGQFSTLREVLYVSMDDLWFAEHRLVELADEFVKQGGRYLFLDEVHKYPSWSREIKNIYDDYQDLFVVFTGSSLLEILNARADLSRRAVTYDLQGLSFREYLHFAQGIAFPRFSLSDLLNRHEEIAAEVVHDLKPLAYFGDYLASGYYPFFKESPDLYTQRLSEVVNLILEIELPQLRKVDIAWTPKLKQLLLNIAEFAPFKPNISALSSKIGINRETLLAYFSYLAESGLTRHLYRDGKGVSRLQKPDKIYLENTNLAYAIRPSQPDMGTIRETFFANQLAHHFELSYPKFGDFLVKQQYVFEIGGPNKSGKQIAETPDFLAVDQIEIGYQNRIPLWLFGFLY